MSRSSILLLGGGLLLLLLLFILSQSERALEFSDTIHISSSSTASSLPISTTTPSPAITAKTYKINLEECPLHTRRLARPGMLSLMQYIHIPKAGGTTIQQSLLQWAKPRFRNFLKDGGPMSWDCPDHFITGGRGGAVLMGHRGYGFCAKLSNQTHNMTFAVALREPVSRFRSLFDYIMENDYPQFDIYHKTWRGKSLSDLVVEADLASRQGYAPGSPELFTYSRFFEFCQQQINFMCGWECVLAPPTVGEASNARIESNLARALEHLERCDIVVVMERLDDMIVQFEFQTINFVPASLRGRFPEENKHTGRKSGLTPEAMRILERWTKHEQVLYAAAQARHAKLTAIARQCTSNL